MCARQRHLSIRSQPTISVGVAYCSGAILRIGYVCYHAGGPSRSSIAGASIGNFFWAGHGDHDAGANILKTGIAISLSPNGSHSKISSTWSTLSTLSLSRRLGSNFQVVPTSSFSNTSKPLSHVIFYRLKKHVYVSSLQSRIQNGNMDSL